MNRKLLNGLLVLAVAAGGVGTFTSCKDENYMNDVLLTQDSLQAKLEAIRNVDDDVFKAALQDWIKTVMNNWTAEASATFGSYEALVQAADDMYELYGYIKAGTINKDLEPFATALYNWMFEYGLTEKFNGIDTKLTNMANDIKALQEALAKLRFSQENRPSSIAVNNVYNPVFGTINLPVGINSTVLASYVYGNENPSMANFAFPVDAVNGHIADASPYKPNAAFTQILDQLATGVSEMLENESFTDSDGVFGNMGGAVVSFNPSSIDINAVDENEERLFTVELLKSNGEVAFSTADNDDCLAIEPFDDVLYFGASRAENADLYALQVNATKANYGDLRFDVDKSGIKDAIKQAWESKTISNIAHLGETVFKSFNNKLPAYAVKVSWNEDEIDASTGQVTGQNTNSVYSEFNLAAAVLHPLSYGTMISAALPSNKKLPIVHNPLTYYFNKLGNKFRIEFDEIEGLDPVEFDIKFIGDGQVVIDLGDGKEAYLDYTSAGVEMFDPNDPAADNKNNLNELLYYIFSSINGQLNSDLNDQVIGSINKSIENINDQLESVSAKLGSFADYLEDLSKSKKLTYAQKLVDVYNELAEKANNFLADPDHYLQVMMAYSTGSGAHHLSNDIYMPTKVLPVPESGQTGTDGFKLITSSYTGDVVVPSYKKYVAITGIVNSDQTISTQNLMALNNSANLNKVYSGTQQECIVNTTDLMGKTVRLTYMSVDYRGVVSMENYYVEFLSEM